jgi:ubiquinone/menaquinone biosynthesis C-methylase UbiE
MDKNVQNAIEANIIVHSRMADEYNAKEPHFRPESIERVKGIVKSINLSTPITKALDLGCGTGFMINILKDYATEITGVDVTQAMLDKVDKTGNVDINLINSDTGTVALPADYFDIATAYTFLDHLYDMRPTFENTYKSLKNGGVFYADLSPSFYFWNAIKSLDFKRSYDSVLMREINAVLKKDEEIEKEFGIDKNIFAMAEHQKHNLGGLSEELLTKELQSVGFNKITFIYHWFVGQAELINNSELGIEQRKLVSHQMHEYLFRSMPLSRHLFKYIGFIAYK